MSSTFPSWTEQLSARRDENFDLFREYINPGFVDLLEMVGFGRRFVKASGNYLYDEHGEPYLDFVAGYGSHNLGHNHPAVKRGLGQTIALDLPGYSQVECSLVAGLVAEKLCQLLPEGMGRVFWCSSGSEAVEAAIKLARAATARPRLLCLERSFHGTTMGSLSLMGDDARRQRFGPFLPGTMRLPIDDLEAAERELSTSDVAGVLIEPVQGEGGARPLSREYVQGLSELCRKNGTLLIADEVQSGLGRTGSWFSFEHYEIQPDAVCLAKSLGGGMMPVGAMVARRDVYKRAYGSVRNCLDHKTTFSGGPLAMAAVWATLKTIDQEQLGQRAAQTGAFLKSGLTELAHKYRQIAQIQGRGLLLGIRLADLTGGLLNTPPLDKLGSASAELFAQYVCLRLLNDHRIIAQVAACDLRVIKVTPPLAISLAQAEGFIAALDSILGEGGHTKAWIHLASKLVAQQAVRISPKK